MSRKETGSHFKRILSHTSSPSGGNAAAQRHIESQSTKKYARLRTEETELDHRRQGYSYKLCPECEPLLSHNFIPPADARNGKAQRVTLQHNGCGHLSPLDFRQDCPRGIMSVTDIELTMGDEDHHSSNLPPGSPMNEYVTYMSTSPVSGSQWPPLVRCTKVSCDENSCLWHRCVLKLPQHVRWEDRIITIELLRNGEESFGFNYKSKQHIGRDEIYTLVSRIDENSKAAKSGLALGDLILSANNVPMQTQQKLPEIDLRTQKKLRLLIQHPVEISSKAASHVEQLRASMMKISEQISNPSVRLPQPPTPSTSPTGPYLSPSGENIPLFALSKQETKNKTRYHQLPKVRIFVCGNATSDFIRCLIGDFISVYYDDRARCIEVSMKKSPDGSVVVGNSESFSYLFDASSESCLNVELVSVSDDRFFHHCCSWMFTPNSIFVLTFDTKRLSLSSEAEMSHLCSLAHTVQTGIPGACTNIKLYGVTPLDDGICPEEVQTLFYTSLGKSLPDPKVIPLVKGALSEEMKQIRRDIFSELIQICERQQVVYPTAVALDMLVSLRRLTITRNELAKTLEDWNIDSKEVGPEFLYKVIEDLRNTGNLLVTGSMNASCISENVKEFVLPCVLFDQLSRLAQCTEKDRVTVRQQDVWTTLYSCGIIARNEFVDVLAVCTSHPEKVLTCMEDLRLVFPVRVLGQDSGFGDVDSILFPYYMQDVPFIGSQADNYELCMTFELSEDIPVSCFYSLLSELSHCDLSHSLKMKAQFTGNMIMQGEDICLHFKKTDRQILMFRSRSPQPTHSVGKQTTPQLIQQVLNQELPSSIKLKAILYSEENGIRISSSKKAPLSDGNSVQAGADTDIKHEEMAAGEETDMRCEEEASSCFPSTPEGASALPNMPIPSELIVDMDVRSGAAFVPEDAPAQEFDEAERAKQAVLEMLMQDLKYIHRELHAICRYLSVNETLQQFAGECGLTLADWKLYEVLVKNQSNRLPAQAFLEIYFKENRVTLREFLQILLRLEQQEHYHLGDMVKNLWTAALCGNSQYVGHLHQNPPYQ